MIADLVCLLASMERARSDLEKSNSILSLVEGYAKGLGSLRLLIFTFKRD